MAAAELIVLVVALYGCATLWPSMTLGVLCFVAGVAADQHNARMPRVSFLVAWLRMSVGRALSRSDDLSHSISEAATSVVAMTAAQAKLILQQEAVAKLEPHAELIAAAAATAPTSAATAIEPADQPKPPRVISNSIRDRLVKFDQ
jgi:hypothetical protein